MGLAIRAVGAVNRYSGVGAVFEIDPLSGGLNPIGQVSLSAPTNGTFSAWRYVDIGPSGSTGRFVLIRFQGFGPGGFLAKFQMNYA